MAGRGWRLLLQVDSTDDMLVGDMGTLYFVSPEADLAAGDVSRVIGIMQRT